MKKEFKISSTLVVTILGAYSYLFADKAHGQGSSATNPFLKDYLTFEVVKNNPLVHSQNRIRGKYATYVFGYRHNLNENWFTGLSFNFRSLERIDNDRELAFLSINHETLYIVRLYHPTYLLFGPKILYMSPTQRSRFPLLRDPDFETEIGAALSLTLTHMLTDSFMLVARMDRWRGTKTNRFHGSEIGLGVQIGL